MLNVLLSFAQYERELTGERIRDKFTASRQKGLWMGGMPLLGYDIDDRKLIVNNEEVKPKYVQLILRINLLAPKIKEAIIKGEQPKGLKLADIIQNIPILWHEQQEVFGVNTI